jgi:hypothetical protein
MLTMDARHWTITITHKQTKWFNYLKIWIILYKKVNKIKALHWLGYIIIAFVFIFSLNTYQETKVQNSDLFQFYRLHLDF